MCEGKKFRLNLFALHIVISGVCDRARAYIRGRSSGEEKAIGWQSGKYRILRSRRDLYVVTRTLLGQRRWGVECCKARIMRAIKLAFKCPN